MKTKLFAMALALVVMGGCAARGSQPPAVSAPNAAATSQMSAAPAPTPQEAISQAPKLPQLCVSATHAALGEVLKISVENAGSEPVSADPFLEFTLRFFDDGARKTALLPIRYTAQPGVYPLTVRVGKTVFRQEIVVDTREFEVQYLEIDEGTAANTAGNEAANREWETKVEPLKAVCDPKPYWSGPFLQPAQGEITTEFGMVRYTNGSKVPSRHSGIDIAADLGDEVHATAAGRVLFADFLQLTGNTVVIEHGLGLKSFYYHMDALKTQPGAMVSQGDVIGLVGSTGYSTGPHLHFAMAVNNVFVNPWTALEKGYPPREA